MEVLEQFLNDLYTDEINIKRLNSELLKARNTVKSFLPKEPLRPIIISEEAFNMAIEESTASCTKSSFKNRIPFKSCLFVFNDYQISIDYTLHSVDYMYLYELSPDCYFAQIGITDDGQDTSQLITFIKIEKLFVETVSTLDANNNLDINILAYMLFMHIQNVLEHSVRNDYKLLEYNSQRKVQYRNFARRRTGKIVYTNECLYIGKKKSLETSKYKEFKIISKPQFASEVMGHWRKLPERCVIGHDREGKEILDWTWVKPYVRGEGDLKVKSRILQS